MDKNELDKSEVLLGHERNHSVVAVVAAGGAIAWLVYRYVDLRLLSRCRYSLDAAWLACLVFARTTSLALSVAL